MATMLVLGGEDVGRATVGGPLEATLRVALCSVHGGDAADAVSLRFRSIQYLRDLKAFFGTTFKIKPVVAAVVGEPAQLESGEAAIEAPEEYVLSCVGTGFLNISKRT